MKNYKLICDIIDESKYRSVLVESVILANVPDVTWKVCRGKIRNKARRTVDAGVWSEVLQKTWDQARRSAIFDAPDLRAYTNASL